MNPLTTTSSSVALRVIPSQLSNRWPLWMIARSAPRRPAYTCAVRRVGSETRGVIRGEDAGQQEDWIVGVNQRILDLIRPVLENHAFERAWTEGQTLTVESALDLALRDSEHSEVVERAAE